MTIQDLIASLLEAAVMLEAISEKKSRLSLAERPLSCPVIVTGELLKPWPRKDRAAGTDALRFAILSSGKDRVGVKGG
jgi:hypothetical protein